MGQQTEAGSKIEYVHEPRRPPWQKRGRSGHVLPGVSDMQISSGFPASAGLGVLRSPAPGGGAGGWRGRRRSGGAVGRVGCLLG